MTPEFRGVGGDLLDRAYLERWIGALGLHDVWSRVDPEDSQ